MIPSNPNPPMTRIEVEHFRKEMRRRFRGDLTPLERQRLNDRKKVYEIILKRNGGKNPLLGS